ncbi:Amidohydrolase [Planctomycetes bacterium CA13]|uniref:Amidohydrolase n=1 Tax=Novipirellula herctigrandis TaxID=2527986 RepID=A0A5C5ZA22_9BACT|nr:Amidohydrolase [Planctomycetes bacterium CA13]
MLIDSHHHLWKYSPEEYTWISADMPILRHDFMAAELQRVASESGIDGFVSVQARQSLEETDWLLGIAQSEPLIRGVVGWVPLASPEITAILDHYANSPVLKGVRHVVQDEPDDRFLLGNDFNQGIALLAERKLVYDILVFARQLPRVIEFVDMHPNQTFVLDHIAKPTIAKKQFDNAWETNLRELAKRENVSCKFSGVVTEVRDPSWDTESLRCYFDVTLEAFSAKRLMFGSDWPVCLLKTDYDAWLRTVREWTSQLSADEQNDFYANNANRIYSL